MLKYILLLSFATSTVSSASVTTYSGCDLGAGSWQARSNSDAARTKFLAALTGFSVIDFEDQPVGQPVPTPLSLDFGVTYTAHNPDEMSGIWAVDDTGIGYNTTLGRSKFLRYSSSTDGNLDAVFTFSKPIDAFGAYFSGDVSGTASVILDDGTVTTLTLTNTEGYGGVQFLGFTDFGESILSVTFRGNTFDIYGIDDVTFQETSAPEPSTLLLFAPLVALVFARQRRKK